MYIPRLSTVKGSKHELSGAGVLSVYNRAGNVAIAKFHLEHHALLVCPAHADN
jgi:hypothetical protein